jgi:hypothetical protein
VFCTLRFESFDELCPITTYVLSFRKTKLSCFSILVYFRKMSVCSIIACWLVTVIVAFQGQHGEWKPIQLLHVTHAFAPSVTVRLRCKVNNHPSSIALHGKGDEHTESFNNEKPPLPALGASRCFSSPVQAPTDTEPLASSSTTNTSSAFSGRTNSTYPTAFVSPKFELQYTCNVCDTRNRVIINRMAYREGMVIAICKGCDSKHWIADNLDPTLTFNNIEELFACRSEGEQQQQQGQQQQQQVSRVTKEVYDIERVWGYKPGEMTDSQGNPVLE